MVCNWSPEPPRGVEERMSAPGQIINAETDSEDETMGNAPAGYELLMPQGLATDMTSDEEDESDNEAITSTANDAGTSNNTPSTSSDLPASEVRETDELYSAPELRRDLAVDCDLVRAAMAGFTLPPSATPAWAADIPESEWAATLVLRIRGGAPEPRDCTAERT